MVEMPALAVLCAKRPDSSAHQWPRAAGRVRLLGVPQFLTGSSQDAREESLAVEGLTRLGQTSVRCSSHAYLRM